MNFKVKTLVKTLNSDVSAVGAVDILGKERNNETSIPIVP